MTHESPMAYFRRCLYIGPQELFEGRNYSVKYAGLEEFTQRAVNIWSSLPTDIANVPNVNTFKI